MNLIITGRHFDVSDELRQYVEKKFKKLGKYFHKLIDIQVTMSLEKHLHVAEAVINADGNRFYGVEKASDMYPSIDRLVKSMEKQAVKNKEKHSGHKAMPAAEVEQSATPPRNETPLLYRTVSDKPKDEIEAFLEMKVDNQDFIVFKKVKNTDNLSFNMSNYAVIYKHEDGLRLAQIPHNLAGEKKPFNKIDEFDLVILKDSITDPEIELKKCRGKKIKNLTIEKAVKEVLDGNTKFLPFFNSDTNFLSIINKSEMGIEVIAPTG